MAVVAGARRRRSRRAARRPSRRCTSESPYRPGAGGSLSRRPVRRRPRDGRCRACASDDRRAHEALAGDRGDVHDVDRGRRLAHRDRAQAARHHRAAADRALHDRRARRVPAAQRVAGGRRRTPSTSRSTSASPSTLGEDGLIVPVVRGAQDLCARGPVAAHPRPRPPRPRPPAHAPTTSAAATFTITNPGQFGSMMATPVISPAAGRDPRRRGDRQAPGRRHRPVRRGRDRDPPDGHPRPVVGSPRARRRARRALPGERQEARGELRGLTARQQPGAARSALQVERTARRSTCVAGIRACPARALGPQRDVDARRR